MRRGLFAGRNGFKIAILSPVVAIVGSVCARWALGRWHGGARCAWAGMRLRLCTGAALPHCHVPPLPETHMQSLVIMYSSYMQRFIGSMDQEPSSQSSEPSQPCSPRGTPHACPLHSHCSPSPPARTTTQTAPHPPLPLPLRAAMQVEMKGIRLRGAPLYLDMQVSTPPQPHPHTRLAPCLQPLPILVAQPPTAWLLACYLRRRCSRYSRPCCCHQGCRGGQCGHACSPGVADPVAGKPSYLLVCACPTLRASLAIDAFNANAPAAQATTPLDPRVLDAMLPFMTDQVTHPCWARSGWGFQGFHLHQHTKHAAWFPLCSSLCGYAACWAPHSPPSPPAASSSPGAQFGNPHSRTHMYGWESENAVEKARAQVGWGQTGVGAWDGSGAATRGAHAC